MIVADNNFVRTRMLNNREVLQQFPFISAYRQQLVALDSQCASCRGTPEARREREDKFNEIKTHVASMPPAEKAKLKEAMQIPPNNQIAMPYRVQFAGGNKTQTVVF